MLKWTLVLTLAVNGSISLFAQGYTYTKIAETGPDSTFAVMEPLGISPSGTVLFVATQKDGLTALFTGTGSTPTKIADNRNGEILSLRGAAINSSGRIVVNAVINDFSTAIYHLDGGVSKAMFRGTFNDGQDAWPRINENGTAVVTTSPTIALGFSLGTTKIITSNGTTHTTIADKTSNLAAATNIGSAGINNRGDVAFIATNAHVAGGLYTVSKGVFTLAVPASPSGVTFGVSFGIPSINDSGAVAFEAISDSLIWGIWRYRPGQPMQLVVARSTNPSISPFVSVQRPMLNQAGTLVFNAEKVNGAPGIYNANNSVISPVIAPGTALFGSTATYTDSPSGQGIYLDDSGRVLFRYILANGRIGIGVATPAGTGAPGSPWLTEGSLANGATYTSGGLVPGSWAQVKGTGLAGETRIWTDADFVGLGTALPTKLSGVEVKVNGIPAAVYFISPTQVTFQVPAVSPGPASVQVIRDGVISPAITATAVASAPGIFPMIFGEKTFAAGVFLDGKITGDPAVNTVFRKAHPGEAVQLFTTGLQPSPAGVLATPESIAGVTIKLGDITAPADAAVLVGVGLFQVNFRIPNEFASLPEAEYPITVQVGGISSPLNINLSPSPNGPVVIPIQH